MRNKDLKKILKNSIKDVEIKDYTNEILNNVNHRATIEAPKAKAHHYRLAFSLGGAALALATILILVFMLKPAIVPPSPITGLMKKEAVLSKEVVALGNALEAVGANGDTSLASYTSTLLASDEGDENDDSDSDNEVEITIDTLDRIALEMNTYLYAASAFINKDNIEVSLAHNNDKKYNYEYKMVIVMNDIDFKKEYILYYDEDKSKNEVEIDGVILIDNESFKVKGEREDDEDEVELELTVHTGDNSYIAISNETELNENEYEYTFYKDGVIIKGVAMEICNENNERRAEIEIIENNLKRSLEFSYFTDHIKAQYQDDDLELEVNIKIYSDYYLYEFSDYKHEIKLNK